MGRSLAFTAAVTVLGGLLVASPAAARAGKTATPKPGAEPPDPPPVADVFAQAQKQGSLVFLEFYASWCGPCREMAATVFPRDDVQAALGKFVVARYNVERGNGPDAANQYNVDGLPTMIVTAADGTLISKVEGGLEAPMLLEFLKEAGDPDDVSAYLDAIHDLGTATTDGAHAAFLTEYLKKRPGGLHAAQAIDDFRLIPEDARPKDLPTILESTRAAMVADQETFDLNALTYSVIALGYPKEAVAFAQAAATLQPDDPDVQDTLAEAYYQNGDQSKAIDTDTAALKVAGDDSMIEDDLDRFKKGVKGLPDDALGPATPLWDPQ
jgi:thioredoxin-like negative regulator of GroEL